MIERRTAFVYLCSISFSLLSLSCGDDDGGSVVVVEASGDIAASVDEFRALLGDPNNGGDPQFHSSGRREISWDGVPDEQASPNFLPAGFFNARGAFFATPGDGVQVSADSDNPAAAAVRFGNFNPSYTESFRTFSAERLFSPIGSNIVDLTFFVPGSDAAATVFGFGAVYTGVGVEDGSTFEYFDIDDQSLGRFSVPVSEDGLSFLGVVFPRSVVKRVRIVYGTTPLGPDEDAATDAAVMDDFLFSEPDVIGCHPDVAQCI